MRVSYLICIESAGSFDDFYSLLLGDRERKSEMTGKKAKRIDKRSLYFYNMHRIIRIGHNSGKFSDRMNDFDGKEKGC